MYSGDLENRTADVVRKVDNNKVRQGTRVETARRQCAARAWRYAARRVASPSEFVSIGAAMAWSSADESNNYATRFIHEPKRHVAYIPNSIQVEEDTSSHAEM